MTAFALRSTFGRDMSRLAILGVNFDGMPAVIYEMRNVRASAVVSVDGIQVSFETSAAGARSFFLDSCENARPVTCSVQDDQNVPVGWPMTGPSGMPSSTLRATGSF